MCVALGLRACGGLLPGGARGWAVSGGHREGCAGDTAYGQAASSVLRWQAQGAYSRPEAAGSIVGTFLGTERTGLDLPRLA